MRTLYITLCLPFATELGSESMHFVRHTLELYKISRSSSVSNIQSRLEKLLSFMSFYINLEDSFGSYGDQVHPRMFLTGRLIASGMIEDSDIDSSGLLHAVSTLRREAVVVERARQRVEGAYMKELWQAHTSVSQASNCFVSSYTVVLLSYH